MRESLRGGTPLEQVSASTCNTWQVCSGYFGSLVTQDGLFWPWDVASFCSRLLSRSRMSAPLLFQQEHVDPACSSTVIPRLFTGCYLANPFILRRASPPDPQPCMYDLFLRALRAEMDNIAKFLLLERFSFTLFRKMLPLALLSGCFY